jgi:hypothetical protein
MNWYKNVLYHTAGVKKGTLGQIKGIIRKTVGITALSYIGVKLSVKKLKNCENGQF